METFLHENRIGLAVAFISIFCVLVKLVNLVDVEEQNFTAIVEKIRDYKEQIAISDVAPVMFVDGSPYEHNYLVHPGLEDTGFDKFDRTLGWVVDNDYWILDREYILTRYWSEFERRRTHISALFSSMVTFVDRRGEIPGCVFRPDLTETGDDLFFLSLGFKSGDLITHINFSPVSTSADIWRELLPFFDGGIDRAWILFERDGERYDVTFELDAYRLSL